MKFFKHFWHEQLASRTGRSTLYSVKLCIGSFLDLCVTDWRFLTIRDTPVTSHLLAVCQVCGNFSDVVHRQQATWPPRAIYLLTNKLRTNNYITLFYGAIIVVKIKHWRKISRSRNIDVKSRDLREKSEIRELRCCHLYNNNANFYLRTKTL